MGAAERRGGGGTNHTEGDHWYAFFGSFMGFGSSDFTSTAPSQDQLASAPHKLNDAILEALSRPEQMAPLIAPLTARGTSRMSRVPQGSSGDAAITLHDAADAGAETWGIASQNDGQIVTD